jgi:hypothetical protein
MKENLTAVFSGSGIGLLIGVLMGLATSPVVGVIIGALASSLALILGLNEKHISTLKSIRIGAFGFACVAGACAGIFIRSHNLLSPNLEELKAQYLRLGYNQEQALAFIAYKEFGILDRKWRMAAPTGTGQSGEENGSDEPTLALTEKQHKSSLYSSEISFSACRDLAGSSPTLPAAEIANNFTVAGGFWNRLGQTVTTYLPEEDWTEVLLLIRDGICAEDENRFRKEIAAGMPDPALNQSCERRDIMDGFLAADGPWHRLAVLVQQRLPERLHKTVLLMIRKELGNEVSEPAH